MQKYKLTLIVKGCMMIGNEFKRVEAKLPLEYVNFDDVQNVLGYLTDGTTNEIEFVLKREEVKIDE